MHLCVIAWKLVQILKQLSKLGKMVCVSEIQKTLVPVLLPFMHNIILW